MMSILFLQAGGSSLDFGEKQVAPKNKSLPSEAVELQLPPEDLNNMRAPEERNRNLKLSPEEELNSSSKTVTAPEKETKLDPKVK